jgi:ABC-2 type transport system permease protein
MTSVPTTTTGTRRGPLDAAEAVLGLTVRNLLNRRRSVLMLLLALSPVLIALLVRLAGRPPDPVRIEVAVLDGLVVRTVLPLVALVFGTAAIGSELEDGTAVYILAKPVPRWAVVLAKLLAAGGLTALLIGPATLVTGLVLAGDQGDGAGIAVAYAVATVVGSFLYGVVFLALSIGTGRALIIGLIYVLIWEGLLAGLFAGSRAFSIREYTIGIAGIIDPESIHAALDPVTAVVMTIVVLVAGFLIATRWLSGYQLRAAE